MKVGIITQSLRVNYGGILQNYALQEVLRRLGHEVVTIDQPCKKEKYYRILLSAIKTLLLKLIGKAGNRRYPMDISRNYRSFISANIVKFIDSYISRSKQLIGYNETRRYVADNGINALIVGSDQVWRPIYNLDICHSFLDFADGLNVKKISYAASFGVENWEYDADKSKRCSELIKQFDDISVRESSGIELCKRFLGVDSKLVLDPTLLLSAKDYRNLSGKTNVKNKGIGVYLLDVSKEKMDFVNRLSQQLDKEVNFIGKPAENGQLPSVEEWIKGFDEAELIVTDSFHGTIFSTIFNKSFYSLVNIDRGSSRFESILSLIGLQNRMLYSPYIADIKDIYCINWDSVNAVIKGLQETSMNFLVRNLS